MASLPVLLLKPTCIFRPVNDDVYNPTPISHLLTAKSPSRECCISCSSLGAISDYLILFDNKQVTSV